MGNLQTPIKAENARGVAERFILDRYPYASIDFERVELKTAEAQQYYEFTGYSRLAEWPESITDKRLCEIQVDPHSADVVSYKGL